MDYEFNLGEEVTSADNMVPSSAMSQATVKYPSNFSDEKEFVNHVIMQFEMQKKVINSTIQQLKQYGATLQDPPKRIPRIAREYIKVIDDNGNEVMIPKTAAVIESLNSLEKKRKQHFCY